MMALSALNIYVHDGAAGTMSGMSPWADWPMFKEFD